MRAFLTGRAGVGSRQDPFRPDAVLDGLLWASWDVEHPDTDAVIGYVVVAERADQSVLGPLDSAPPGAVADLGDPTDRASMRSVTIGEAAAHQILTLIYGSGGYNNGAVNRVKNMTGAQAVRYLNRKDPVMRAEWGDVVADLVDASDV